MARARIFDHLQVYPFWVIDLAATPFGGNAFFPMLGFQSCTSPEVTLEHGEVREANWPYPHHYVTRATVGSITLTRGVLFMDSDFYKWAMRAIEGLGTVKRDLMLIHYFALSPVQLAIQLAEQPASRKGGLVARGLASAGIGGAMMAQIIRNLPPAALADFLAPQGAGLTAEVISKAFGYSPPVEFASRFPAKAWILRHCLPTRWKATSDFDATSGDVAIAELEVQPHRVEEVTFTG